MRLARISRLMSPAETNPSVKAGRTIPRSCCPLIAGSHWRWTATRRIKRSPSQNRGIETPSSASSMAPLSSQVFS